MANAGSARPPYGDVAGLRQLEQVLEFCIPSDSDAATRERNLGPLARGSCWRVGWAHRRSGYAWSHGFTRAKNFHVHAIGGDTPGSKTSTQILQECGWSTQVEVCVARHTKFDRARVCRGVQRRQSLDPIDPRGRACCTLSGCGCAAAPEEGSRDSCANGWSSRLRAPYSHQTWRGDASAASAWSMARTGVAPTPALSRTMGRSS